LIYAVTPLNQEIQTMTSPRTDRKTDYRHFPAEYGDMFEQFARDGAVRLGPMPYNKANSSRRDLYRYRLFLINAVEEDPDDTFARELYDAARNVTMRIEGTGSQCFIVLELNPIVAAMRAPEATSEAGSDSPGESRHIGEPCPAYCGWAECYIGSEDDNGPEKFRCMKSTAPAREIKP
jgi:hypothetical protein